MNRIRFVSDNRPVNNKFIREMRKSGIEVCYGEPCLGDDKETLYVVDSSEAFKRYPNSLVVIEDTCEIDDYPEAEYFVMDVEDNEADYFVKIWQRLNNIPWTIALTDNLIIRETIETDVDVFYKMYQNPAMSLYTEKLYSSIEEERKYVSEYRKKVYGIQGFGIWTIINRKSNEIIGRAGLITRAGFDDVEVGYAIGCDYQNRGYATEAVRECIKIAHRLEFERIYALIIGQNIPSKRVLEKCGFSYSRNVEEAGQKYEMWDLILK